MALVPDAKRSLWAALRAMRCGDQALARKHVENALLYLELTREAIDPALKLK